VRPARRRRGIGTALLRAGVDQLAAAGRRTVTGEVVEGTDGVGFAEAAGFRCVLRDRRSILVLADLDRDRLAALAGADHPGYELRLWHEEVPEDMLDRYAEAKQAMNDAPQGDLDLSPVRFDAERVRARVELQLARGNRAYHVVAVDSRTGAVAGLTELVVWARVLPMRGDQQDTCVVPAHRGRGLGLWMKAAMLRHLLAVEPALVDIQTWNAETNTHMLAVNAALGFRRERAWREYQAAVDAVQTR